MLFISIPYDIKTVVKKESSLTGKSVRQIVIERLRGATVEKIFTPELRKSLLKLDEIKSLKRNWNGNNAKPISKRIICNARTLVINLNKQPQIFPTANESIQFEYDGVNNSYLELQVTKKKIIAYYKVDKNGNETMGELPFSTLLLNELVEEFYG